MTDAARRFYCRTGFVLGCFLPTLIVAVWIAVRCSPLHAAWQEQAWRQAISRTLGLAARVESIAEPRPGAYVLTHVSLHDPDAPSTSPPLASAKRVEIARGPTGLVILASETAVASEHLPRLWTVLHERLVRGPELSESAVHVALSSLTLAAPQAAPEHSLTLTDVRLQLASNTNKAQAALEFRVAGAAGEPARLAITRDRAQLPVATKWELHSGATPLPCSALAPCLPPVAQLGNKATFFGTLQVATRDQSWDAELAGWFREVNLDTLVSAQFPHKLTGLADVTLNKALWQHGRLTSAAGNLQARGGTVSQSLLDEAQRSLGMAQAPRDQRTPPQRRYSELALGFALDGSELRIAGQCAQAPEATVLADGGRAILLASAERAVEPVALVRALLPQSDMQVPAVQEVRQLIYLLPLPAATRPEAETPAYRQVRLQD